MDRLAEIDNRFKFLNFVESVGDTDAEHKNSDLFNRIFDLLEVIRTDSSMTMDQQDASRSNLNQSRDRRQSPLLR